MGDAIIPLNDLRRGVAAHRGEIDESIRRVVESGWFLNGPERQAFEQEFGNYLGVETCVGVANGTDALEIALRACECQPGDEVVLAANAGMYGATAALRAELRLRYADVESDTLCLSWETVAAALGPETRAVVVTHLYGSTADIEPIVCGCREHGVLVIEDCAQSAGASRDGRRAGSFGDVAAVSFYPTKNLGALGDSGAVVTSSARTAERARSLSQYGWETKYNVSLAGGRNSRLDELQAAILRARLPHLDATNERRRTIVDRYRSAISAAAGRIVSSEGESYVAHLAVLLTPPGERDRIARRLNKSGITTEIHYPVPDHRQPLFADSFATISLPITEAAAAQVLTLPCFPELTEDEIDRVCEALGAL